MYTQAVLNIAQLSRLDNMQDMKMHHCKLHIANNQEDSRTKTKAHATEDPCMKARQLRKRI